MTYDAACYVASTLGVSRLVIAGEQSYTHHDDTTGNVLDIHTPAIHRGLELTVLKNETNRLLNTPHQVDALADEFSSDDSVVVVCWGFHERRLSQGFKHKNRLPAIDFVHTEDVIDMLWDDMTVWGDLATRRHMFRDRYDLQVDWDIVRDRGLTSFEKRERVTRWAMKTGHSGWLLKLLTKARGSGRYDDIDSFALPRMGSTH